jgi:hypothetical protein
MVMEQLIEISGASSFTPDVAPPLCAGIDGDASAMAMVTPLVVLGVVK